MMNLITKNMAWGQTFSSILAQNHAQKKLHYEIIMSIIFIFLLLNYDASSQDFTQTMLLDGADSLVSFDIDTTGN